MFHARPVRRCTRSRERTWPGQVTNQSKGYSIAQSSILRIETGGIWLRGPITAQRQAGHRSVGDVQLYRASLVSLQFYFPLSLPFLLVLHGTQLLAMVKPQHTSMHTTSQSVLILTFGLLKNTNQNPICSKKSTDEILSNYKVVSYLIPLTQTYENNRKHLNILVTVSTQIKASSRHYIIKIANTQWIRKPCKKKKLGKV